MDLTRGQFVLVLSCFMCVVSCFAFFVTYLIVTVTATVAVRLVNSLRITASIFNFYIKAAGRLQTSVNQILRELWKSTDLYLEFTALFSNGRGLCNDRTYVRSFTVQSSTIISVYFKIPCYGMSLMYSVFFAHGCLILWK